MCTIYHIEPLYKSFIWAGKKLIDRFDLKTDLDSLGTIYCAIAIPGELDNVISETGQPLSEFYTSHQELFDCPEPDFPVRMTITCNEGFQSYQSHPDDAYALAHDGVRGKVSGAVALDASDHVGTWLFGHKVADRETFRRCIEAQDWDCLFDTLEVKDGDFVHTPAGVIHGGWGAGIVSATFGTNGDVTYRFFDNNRNDPARPLNIDAVCDCASFPELDLCAERVEPVFDGGAWRYDYHDVGGEYVAKRYQVSGEAAVSYDGFLIVTCVAGEGAIDDVAVAPGETLLIPAGYGTFSLHGELDLIAVSYHSVRGAHA